MACRKQLLALERRVRSNSPPPRRKPPAPSACPRRDTDLAGIHRHPGWGDVAPEMPSSGAGTVARNTPELVDGNHAFVSLATGYYHACALTATGAAYCWGSGFSGQLGDGSVIDYRASPSAVMGGLRFASVSGGYWHTCGVSVQGAAYCWGNNNWAQLGDSTRAAHGAPAPVSGAVVFAKLAAGGRHTCGLSMAAMRCAGAGTRSVRSATEQRQCGSRRLPSCRRAD